ncbi:hypothetical protein A6X20_31755 [Bradyrhizobium elkanii]|nr:hypothetical protein A6X20_31755 [Bradyrhizobium elkanii]
MGPSLVSDLPANWPADIFQLVVVDELDLFWTFLSPRKADAELIVHADGMLAPTVALQGFEPIAGRGQQVVKIHGRVQVLELTANYLLQISRKAFLGFAVEGRFGQLVLEALDHELTCIMS